MCTVRGVAIEIGLWGPASRFLSRVGKLTRQPASFCLGREISIFFLRPALRFVCRHLLLYSMYSSATRVLCQSTATGLSGTNTRDSGDSQFADGLATPRWPRRVQAGGGQLRSRGVVAAAGRSGELSDSAALCDMCAVAVVRTRRRLWCVWLGPIAIATVYNQT